MCLHIPRLGFDGLVGYSPIAMAKNAIGMVIVCEEYGAKFFVNGAQPSGGLEHQGTLKDPSRVRESWQSTFDGSHNANKVAVLEEGMKSTPCMVGMPQQGRMGGCRHDIRELENLDRIPEELGGDLYFINGNMTKLADADIFAKVPWPRGKRAASCGTFL